MGSWAGEGVAPWKVKGGAKVTPQQVFQ